MMTFFWEETSEIALSPSAAQHSEYSTLNQFLYIGTDQVKVEQSQIIYNEQGTRAMHGRGLDSWFAKGLGKKITVADPNRSKVGNIYMMSQ